MTIETVQTGGKTPLSQSAALAFILAVGGCLRFYQLDTPSMWADEMLVALMATFPVPYIAKWAMALEVHPPTYHYFYKLVEQFGASDFVLRLPSALAGTASIWLVWRAGRVFFGAPTALFAAALLAGNPLHVWLSRQVRPYALMVFFFLLAFTFLGQYLRSGDRRQLAKAMLANLPLLLSHYISILVIGAQGVVLGVTALARMDSRRFKDVALFAAGSLASFAPAAPFFVAMMVKRQDMNAKVSFLVVWERTLEYATGLFNLYSHPALTWALVGLWIAGMALILIRGRGSHGWLAYCLAFMALPFAVILYQRYNTFYFSSHISFMLAAVVFPAGYALAFLVRRAALAPLTASLTATALAALILFHDYSKLYREDSTIIGWWHFGTFKHMARLLPERIRPEHQLVFSDMILPNAINWYLRRFTVDNPVESPRLGPEDPGVVHFLSNTDTVGNLFSSTAAIARCGKVIANWKLDSLNVVSVEMPRTRVHAVSALPFALDVTGHPGDFFGKVLSMEGLAVKPDWGGTLHPTRYGVPGYAEFELQNRLPGEAASAALAIRFANIGEADEIALEYALDDDTPIRVPVSRGPDRNGIFIHHFTPGGAWSRLRWRLIATCAGRTPYGYGGSLQTVQIKSAHAWLCSTADSGPCDQRVYESMVRSAQDSHQGVSFAGQSQALPQEITLPEAGLRIIKEGEPGWRVFMPESPGRATVIRVKAAAHKEQTIFYPRVGGGSFVSARPGGPGEEEPETFRLMGLDGSWTPIGAMYPLPLPAGKDAEVSITLSGPWAQLWAHEGAVLFAAPR